MPIDGYYDGKPACRHQLAWLPVMNEEARRLGVVRHKVDITQLIGGYVKSGGTHANGGAADFLQTSTALIRWCRTYGARATWHRPRGWDGADGIAHTHSVLDCPCNGPARYQQAAVEAGYNGLGLNGRGGRDTGPRPIIKRTWKQGIRAAGRDLPTRKTPAPVKLWAKANGTPARLYPGVGPVVRTRKAGFRAKAVAYYTDTSGRLHFKTKYGTWYAAADFTDRKPGKKSTILRVGLWNVALITPVTDDRVLADRVRRIRKRVKQYRLDVLGTVECKIPGQGSHLAGKLVGRDGKPMQRVGGKNRHLWLLSSAVVHAHTMWKVEGKWALAVAATVRGKRRAFLVGHAESGNASGRRAAYADGVQKRFAKWAAEQGVPARERIYLGDWNGPEFAQRGSTRGLVRARKRAGRASRFKRTFQAFGRKPLDLPGGQFDYVLTTEAKAQQVTHYRNVHTPKASDHNLVIVRFKE